MVAQLPRGALVFGDLPAHRDKEREVEHVAGANEPMDKPRSPGALQTELPAGRQRRILEERKKRHVDK